VFPRAGNKMTLQNVEWAPFKTFLILEENFKDNKHSMYANKSRFNKLRDYFLDLDFNRDNFREFIHEMQKDGYSEEYQNRLISMAKNITKYIDDKFLEDFKYRTVSGTKEKILPTIEEIIAIIDCEYPHKGAHRWFLNTRDHAMLMLFAYTGCRAGEISNLEWRDLVDEGNRKKVIFRDTKNGETRFVYVPNQVWEAIDEIPRKNNYVFASYRGKQILNQGINQTIKNRAKHLGIQKNLHAHLLRHAFITEMLDGGAEWFRLASMVGHKDPKTTQRYYQNSTKSQEDLMKLHPLNRQFITFDDVVNEALESAKSWMSIDKCDVNIEKSPNGNISIHLNRL
jgi:site-specific recombinase XerD